MVAKTIKLFLTNADLLEVGSGGISICVISPKGMNAACKTWLVTCSSSPPVKSAQTSRKKNKMVIRVWVV